jgi:hypothetical protein
VSADRPAGTGDVDALAANILMGIASSGFPPSDTQQNAAAYLADLAALARGNQDRDRLLEQMADALDVLEKAAGVAVIGFQLDMEGLEVLRVPALLAEWRDLQGGDVTELDATDL